MKNRDRLIKVFFGLWLLCFTFSFLLPFLMEAKGDGFTRGLNRIGALMGWQLAATAFAFIGFAIGFGRLSGRRGLAWLSRGPAIVQATLIVALLGLIFYVRFIGKPVAEPAYAPPKTSPAPAATAEPEPAGTHADVRQTETFSGIYHRGFESSHFYSSDGRGPWWVETSNEADQELTPYFVDGPGRAGGITVALKINGWLSDDVSDLTHLGAFQKRLHLVSIDSIRSLSQEEFDQVRTAFLDQK